MSIIAGSKERAGHTRPADQAADRSVDPDALEAAILGVARQTSPLSKQIATPAATTNNHPPAPQAPPTFTRDDAARLSGLIERGTPAATRQAYDVDLAYITAWRRLTFHGAPEWPEDPKVVLRYILDHSEDLTLPPHGDGARRVGEALIAEGRRRSLAAPAKSSLARRLATWSSLHRLRGLASPFDNDGLRMARRKAYAAAPKGRGKASPVAITRTVLDALLAPMGDTLADLRDRAMFTYAYASGGRRRSDIIRLAYDDLNWSRYQSEAIIGFTLPFTKTTRDGSPALRVQGMAAHAMAAWIRAGHIATGTVFRPISRHGAVGAGALDPSSLNLIIKKRAAASGLKPPYPTAHGFRSGFMTDADRMNAPLQDIMRLSLHKDVRQARSYMEEAELDDNPALDILDISGS